jgi:hypothetical protein
VAGVFDGAAEVNITDAILGIFMLLITWSCYLAQKDPNISFNLFDLIMENGRVSRIGFGFVVALLVTSWVLVRVARDGKMSLDMLFAAYGTMWVAPIVAKLFSPAQPAGTTTTVEAGATKTTVQVVDPPKGIE